MKKNLLRLLFIAAITLPLMCSCSKEDEPNGNRDEVVAPVAEEVNYTGEWELEMTILGPVEEASVIVNVGAGSDTGEIHLYDFETGEEVGELVKGSHDELIQYIIYPESAEDAHFHLKTSDNCIGISFYSQISNKVNEFTPIEYQWTIRKDGFHVGSDITKVYDPLKSYLEVHGRTLLETL